MSYIEICLIQAKNLTPVGTENKDGQFTYLNWKNMPHFFFFF